MVGQDAKGVYRTGNQRLRAQGKWFDAKLPDPSDGKYIFIVTGVRKKTAAAAVAAVRQLMQTQNLSLRAAVDKYKQGTAAVEETR